MLFYSYSTAEVAPKDKCWTESRCIKSYSKIHYNIKQRTVHTLLSRVRVKTCGARVKVVFRAVQFKQKWPKALQQK